MVGAFGRRNRAPEDVGASWYARFDIGTRAEGRRCGVSLGGEIWRSFLHLKRTESECHRRTCQPNNRQLRNVPDAMINCMAFYICFVAREIYQK